MGKDELKSSDCCPDCAEGEAASDPDGNDTECCCCCCSCSESASESESNNVSIGTEGNQAMASLEQRKREMLSNLTILKTNREQVSVQHLLQFIEAMNHSPDFLRRYNLQEDFCLECLLSEPTCTCCITGVSQMNLNDENCNSCDECNRDESLRQERHTSQGCSDCFSMRKASSSERPRTENRRERRRRRRRQRHSQHILPRVSVANISPHARTLSTHLPHQSTSNRRTGAPNTVSVPLVSQDEIPNDNDSCDECCREETSRRRNSPDLRRCSDFAKNSVNEDDSDFCEECTRSNSLSASCAVPGCNECGNHPDDTLGNSSLDEENRSCPCCIDSPKQSGFDKKSKDKKQNSPKKPEYDKSGACSECSDCEQDSLSAPCTVPGCKECGNHRDEIHVNNSFDEGSRSCSCCIDSPKVSSFDKKSKDKKQDASKKPECDKNGDCCECSDCGQDQPAEKCTCEECQENSDCSEESCNECKNHNLLEKKKKK